MTPVEQRRQQVAELWARGLRASDIARELGIGRATVSLDIFHLRCSGEPVAYRRGDKAAPHPGVAARRKRVVELWRRGFSAPQIAGRLGATEAQIDTDLRWLRVSGRVAPHDLHANPERVTRRSKVAKLWLRGHNASYIGSVLGIARSTVYEDLDRCRAEGQQLPYRKPALRKKP